MHTLTQCTLRHHLKRPRFFEATRLLRRWGSDPNSKAHIKYDIPFFSYFILEPLMLPPLYVQKIMEVLLIESEDKGCLVVCTANDYEVRL